MGRTMLGPGGGTSLVEEPRGELVHLSIYPATIWSLCPLLQSKYEQVQKSLGEVEKHLEEAQQKIQLSDAERKQAGGGEPGGLDADGNNHVSIH